MAVGYKCEYLYVTLANHIKHLKINRISIHIELE